MQMLPVLLLIPVSMLLGVSFFILFVAEKVKSSGLKTFGQVVAVFMCLSAAAVFGVSVFTLACCTNLQRCNFSLQDKKSSQCIKGMGKGIDWQAMQQGHMGRKMLKKGKSTRGQMTQGMKHQMPVLQQSEVQQPSDMLLSLPPEQEPVREEQVNQ